MSRKSWPSGFYKFNCFFKRSMKVWISWLVIYAKCEIGSHSLVLVTQLGFTAPEAARKT